MDKISVIVPIYNCEQYLERCIESIRNQTFSNLEIILVNDGSTDASIEICRFYEQLDSRVKVVDKTNGGAAEARNYGLRNATGKYIGFVDSDDYIDAEMYEVLYNNIMENHSVIASGIEVNLYDENLECAEKESLFIEKTIQKEQLVKGLLYHNQKFLEGVCNKLFHKSLFENNEFPIGLTNEDVLVVSNIYMRIKEMHISSRAKYYYCHRDNSVTTSKFSEKTYDRVEISKRVNKNFENLEYKFIKSGQKFNELYAQRGVVYKMYISGITDQRYKSELKKYRKMFIGSVLDFNVPKLMRAKFFLTFISPKMYFFCLNKWKQ